MYVFGGFDESIESFSQDVHRLDLSTYTWKLLSCVGEPPVDLYDHSATAIGQLMVIFGGGGSYSNKVSYFDTNTSTWHSPAIHQPMPSGRGQHSAISLGMGKMLVFGGFNDTEEHKDDLWLLDTESWAWTKVEPHGAGPNPRQGQALVKAGNRIFLFGGTSPYYGPPLYFTPEQLALLPQNEDHLYKWMTHNDLYVLDLAPSLKTLAIMAIKRHMLSTEGLPGTLLKEIYFMTASNDISQPLRTVECLSTD